MHAMGMSRPIIPRTITGASDFVYLDANGAGWNIFTIDSSTMGARSTTYSPPGRVYAPDIDGLKKKIGEYANVHAKDIGIFKGTTNYYIDENGAIWFKTDEWQPYLDIAKFPPLGTPHYIADTSYYKPYTMITGENDFELKDAIDKFAYSYKGSLPVKDSSKPPAEPPVPGEVPPVVIKAEPKPPEPLPGPPVTPIQPVAGGASSLPSIALGSVAAISGIMWWRSR